MASRPESADGLDLTGIWNGLYSYPRAIEPVSFVATLSETDGWLSGGTEEIASAGTMRGQMITASLQGRRIGHSITFLKTYDRMPQGYDTVQYTGDVNSDCSEIEGHWKIPGVWSGKFLMNRAGLTETALLRDVAERV
jgi:hypothetical protein